MLVFLLHDTCVRLYWELVLRVSVLLWVLHTTEITTAPSDRRDTAPRLYDSLLLALVRVVPGGARDRSAPAWRTLSLQRRGGTASTRGVDCAVTNASDWDAPHRSHGRGFEQAE